jgi:hypothetical protein
MENQNIVWAAGLFDGEGCISIRLNRPTETSKHKSPLYALVVKVTMCDQKTIHRLKEIFSVGHITLQKRNLPWHDVYSWTCMSSDAVGVLDKIGPLLFTKQKEFQIAKEFAALPSGQRGRTRIDPTLLSMRERIYIKLRDQKNSNFYEGCDSTIEQPRHTQQEQQNSQQTVRMEK